jgi:hypothetical protein
MSLKQLLSPLWLWWLSMGAQHCQQQQQQQLQWQKQTQHLFPSRKW